MKHVSGKPHLPFLPSVTLEIHNPCAATRRIKQMRGANPDEYLACLTRFFATRLDGKPERRIRNRSDALRKRKKTAG